jgi:hypothetical protein
MFSKENENRIITATSYTIPGSAYTRMFPELIPEVVKIIQGEQELNKKFPSQFALTRRVCDLKLAILVPKLLCDEIQSRVDRSIADAARATRSWAKDKSFGPYLDNKGVMDQKKLKKLYLAKGQAEFSRVRDEYNELCVPYANALLKQDQWKPHEIAQARVLQDLQRNHNDLATQARRAIEVLETA